MSLALMIAATSVVLAAMPAAMTMSAASTGPEAFIVPPPAVGETVQYASGEASFVATVQPRADALEPDGTRRSSVPIRIEWHDGSINVLHTDQASGRTLRLDLHCVEHTEDGCNSFRTLSWRERGDAGLFGAGVLQGRPVSAGMTFTLDGDCEPCTGEIHVRIEPPEDDSPNGTVLIAHLTGSPTIGFLSTSNATLHVGATSAFPLRIDLPDRQYVLQSHTNGSDGIAMGGGMLPGLAPVATPVPFEAGLPAEGDPIAGYPSWRSAREAAGPVVERGRFISVEYRLADSWIELAGQRVNESREHEWKTVFGSASGTRTITRHHGEQLFPDHLPHSQTIWSRQVLLSTGAPPAEGCLEQSVPLWKFARIALAQQAVSQLRGISLVSFECTEFEALVAGPTAPGRSFGVGELTAMNPLTGHFLSVTTLSDI